ncbi:MAG: host attachment protein, partial [Bdellovibrionales bacterium]|nr:host attachment protein [Bdellovibrionales bacterium]
HEGPGKGLESLAKEEMEGNTPAGRDIMSDAPGRSFSSHGPGRSAMEPPTDPRDQVESEFRGSVADNIERLMKKKDAQRLIVAADPRSLGELRKELSPQLQEKLTATLDKDLTNIPDHDLPKHFEDVLAV